MTIKKSVKGIAAGVLWRLPRCFSKAFTLGVACACAGAIHAEAQGTVNDVAGNGVQGATNSNVAQASQPQQQQPQPQAPAPAAATATAPTTNVDSQALDYLYHQNPGDGSAAGVMQDQATEAKAQAGSKQGGMEAMMGAESLISPDFEKYLSSAEVDKDRLKKYNATVEQIRQLLKQRKPADAWDLLFTLGSYEWDADLSKQIAIRVRAVWDTNETARRVMQENANLQKTIRQADWNADAHAESMARKQEWDRPKSTKSGAPQVNSASSAGGGMAGTMKMTEEYFRALDSRAKIKLNDVKMDTIQTKAKSDLADYVTTLYKDKRYVHAVIASDFYQALFTDGELPPSLANTATASLEARRSIASAVEAFRFNVQNAQIVSGSQILQKAYEMGDTMPEMIGLERDLKLKVVQFYTKLRRMKNMVEARDFENLEPVLADLDKIATDLDTTKPRKLMQAVKLESRIHLGNARLAAEQGNQSKAMAEFKAAAQIWPGNPDLQKAASNYFDSEDGVNKSATEFDRLISEGNYRAIVDKQLSFLPGIANDKSRQEKMKIAMEKVRLAEGAIEKANLLAGGGDKIGAWESLELVTKDWPDDGKMNKLRADYAVKAAEFVSTLNKAQEAEQQKQYGYSLSCYLNAQRLYPPSQIANSAIQRLTDAVLRESGADAKSSGK